MTPEQEQELIGEFSTLEMQLYIDSDPDERRQMIDKKMQALRQRKSKDLRQQALSEPLVQSFIKQFKGELFDVRPR